MALRKALFWIHLSVGLTVGTIVAIMSATGISIAFEREILNWIDRDLKTIVAPDTSARMTFDQLDAAVATQHPNFKTTTRIAPRALDQAYEYRAGRDGTLYVNPYTGAAVEPKSNAARDVLRTLTEWHRWLGMEGQGRETGKLITGIANLGFLFLCISGLYMWWPRSWSPKAWRPAVWFVGRIKGRARDFNWHHVFGSWSVLVLIVIVTGGVMISFPWANRLIFTLAGEEAPLRGVGAQTTPQVVVPSPAAGQEKLTRDALFERVTKQYSEWQSLSFESAQNAKDANAIRPISVTVLNAGVFQNKNRVQLSVDPYRGDVLSKVAFADRTPATRARTWLRFLHTGEAFGFAGKVLASFASAGSLFLIYTGFALSYRRFFTAMSRTPGVASGAATNATGTSAW
jgi:uncharacterized iron-regulated membrane protein